MGSAPITVDDGYEEDEDLEAAGRRADGYQPLVQDAVRNESSEWVDDGRLVARLLLSQDICLDGLIVW